MLSVISRSPTDVQPVFDMIALGAARLCKAEFCFVYRFDGQLLHFAAQHGVTAETLDVVRRAFPSPPNRGSVAARAVLDCSVVQIADVALDADFAHSRIAAITGFRSAVGVPMLRSDRPIGSIAIGRTQPGFLTDRQIKFLKTFADQAVIAIEIARLFEEVQERTRDLSESLEFQTATSEILRVISSSPTDIQPVFDTIAANALRLCEATFSAVLLFDGDVMRLASHHKLIDPEAAEALQRAFPRRPQRGGATDQAILTGRIAHIPDVEDDPSYQHSGLASATGYRSILAVPMLSDGQAVGVIAVTGGLPRAFSNRQIDLLKTFADQAVIAIGNTRLFEEVQARNRDLTALGDVGRAVSSTLDLKAVLKTIVDRAVELSGTDAGSIYYYREEVARFELGETSGLDEEVIAKFRNLDITLKGTALGEAIAKRQPLQFSDVTKRGSSPLRDAALEVGLSAVLIVPLLSGEDPLGALVLQRRQPGEFPQAVVTLMQSFADQSAIALENARLFEDIAQKSRELEIASQHKSQFVANMSHELRTPLAAILGYAELMQEGFYGTPTDKSMDALTRIKSNGKHLLGLINTVLDIAKIESGQFSLNLAEYAIESVVETVRAATESLAETKKLALKTEVAKKLPIGLGDEQRLTQVLLNLVGNAIKFTDAGEVRITATALDGHFTVGVTDTGPGIPPEELTRVFEQFHQIDNSNTKAKGGTGLGLAIAKQIVEMHGGRIWVELTPGQGATFQMQLPIRAEFRKATS